MDKLLMRNAWNAKFFLAGLLGCHMFYWYGMSKPKIMAEVYGKDGNGGKMLKIIILKSILATFGATAGMCFK